MRLCFIPVIYFRFVSDYAKYDSYAAVSFPLPKSKASTVIIALRNLYWASIPAYYTDLFNL